MSNTSFKFNSQQYAAIKKAVKGLTVEITKMATETTGAIEQAAYQYKYAVRSAILNQTFPTGFRPLSKKYASWKKKVHGTVPDFWNLTGSVVKNLKVVRVLKSANSSIVVSGLMTNRQKREAPYGAKGSKSKNPYRQVGVKQTNATDYAVMVNNMRPLFGPVFMAEYPKMQSRIYSLWRARMGYVWR